MNAFEVRVNGKNFLVDVDGGFEKRGFLVNVYIHADSRLEAENTAIIMVRELGALRSILRNQKTDPPLFCVDEIGEIENFDEIEPKIQSLIWYSENES